ncbi:hypothetical protein M569_10935 [Genlisea aurea]|uniref:Laccase n=1 Tax=Genlisea aurea TaxID=192259 RepID=S8DVF2_9LAMI|nr:hypothetical protein M569_10935 [Genlisea aurea]
MLSDYSHLSVVFFLLLSGFSSIVSSAIVEHDFHVENLRVRRLCEERVITAVNGRFPGPTIHVHEGDTLVVTVHNDSPYNISIHWHGILQKLSGWADGPAYVSQCPIRPGNKYVYRFTIKDQEGTLWWHAHVKWLRATVYGALIIKPDPNRKYPFPEPHGEFPILIGEWWNADVLEVESWALAVGGAPNISDAFTMNGQPGDLYDCSSNETYNLWVEHGRRYLLRVINSALNNQLFFKVAGHTLTVVAIDASYTNPYKADVLVLSPGQTVDALLHADRRPGRYYMAAAAYVSAGGSSYDATTTTGILNYYSGSEKKRGSPKAAILPNANDLATASKFYTNLTGLVTAPFWEPVPTGVDEHFLITVGYSLTACGLPGNESCAGNYGLRLAASMNDASFQLPTQLSILEAFFRSVEGVYTADFPNYPPVRFDYTNPNVSLDLSLLLTTKSTEVKKVRYGSVIEMVLQDTALLGTDHHPIHLHGFNFHILAQGYGNYDPSLDAHKLNFENPQIRNTVAVPIGGWAVIRFRANNPGVWFLHCHLDTHLSWGLAAVLAVENGPDKESTLPPPPSDFPKCR